MNYIVYLAYWLHQFPTGDFLMQFGPSDRHFSEFCWSKSNKNLAVFVSADLPIEGQSSELNFHIWIANWPMKSEAKMATYGG